ncbi:VOC family protein [Glutamicibacter sp. M10]|uniref:VOC family protein n=1 Tax=Glutamicibacter sp. M10 TaxID=3023076 RepID=UPI0021C7280A|nr:VOC family protein [Glutamicibacter sp. M10]UXN32810.1 VOC family protein [Glutamicibacter sp. M10]
MPVVRGPRAEPCWVDLLTSDIDGAIEFYSELFGWKIHDDPQTRSDGYLPVTLDDQPVTGLVLNDQDSAAPDAWTTYLNVADIHAAVFAAHLHGGQRYLKPVAMPGQGTVALIGDPAGIGVGLWQSFDPTNYPARKIHGHRIWNELHTKHFETACRFYREALGWDLNQVVDSPDFSYYTLGQGADAAAGLYDISGQDSTEGWRTYFAVDDADQVAQLCTSLGGQVVNAPHDSYFGRTAMLSDRGGAEFAVIAPAHK